MIIFNDLLNCMEEISSIYIKLYRLELLGEKNGSYFDNLVNDLKKLLIKEKELFSAFENDSDYGILKSFILDEEGPVFSRLREYINLNDKKNPSGDEEDRLMTINLNKLSSVCIKNIFLIYLSFFQEYVDSVENWELKDKLLNLKYYEAFTKLEIGNLLIEHKFHVSRENYVDLYLIADILKIGDMDSYDIIFSANFGLLTDMIRQLLLVKDEQYKEINTFISSKEMEFMIRACFSLLSNNDYESIKDEIFEIIDKCSNEKNVTTVEIVENILSSRIKDVERVKRISLRPMYDGL